MARVEGQKYLPIRGHLSLPLTRGRMSQDMGKDIRPLVGRHAGLQVGTGDNPASRFASDISFRCLWPLLGMIWSLRHDASFFSPPCVQGR